MMQRVFCELAKVFWAIDAVLNVPLMANKDVLFMANKDAAQQA